MLQKLLQHQGDKPPDIQQFRPELARGSLARHAQDAGQGPRRSLPDVVGVGRAPAVAGGAHGDATPDAGPSRVDGAAGPAVFGPAAASAVDGPGGGVAGHRGVASFSVDVAADARRRVFRPESSRRGASVSGRTGAEPAGRRALEAGRAGRWRDRGATHRAARDDASGRFHHRAGGARCRIDGWRGEPAIVAGRAGVGGSGSLRGVGARAECGRPCRVPGDGGDARRP